MGKKASSTFTTSPSAVLPLSKALALAKEALGALKFAQSSIVSWLASASDPLRYGARVIEGVLPGQLLKGMTRKQAEAEALRDLFSGRFSIEWEEDWVRKQDGVFVFTAYGFWVDADDFEARLSALLGAPPPFAETVVAEVTKSADTEPEHVKYGMPAPKSPEQTAIQAFVINMYGSKWRTVAVPAMMRAGRKDAEFSKAIPPSTERSTWRRALGLKKD